MMIAILLASLGFYFPTPPQPPKAGIPRGEVPTMISPNPKPQPER